MGNIEETMTDDSDKTEDTSPGRSPGRAQPDVAFRQTMNAVETRCDQLIASIEHHDGDKIAYTARNAVNMWLAGRAACRRLVERNPVDSPLADAARNLLEVNYMKLLELFAGAAKTINDLWMRRVLRELRASLLAANARPLSDDTVVTPRSDEPKQT